mgnify:FL=1
MRRRACLVDALGEVEGRFNRDRALMLEITLAFANFETCLPAHDGGPRGGHQAFRLVSGSCGATSGIGKDGAGPVSMKKAVIGSGH